MSPPSELTDSDELEASPELDALPWRPYRRRDRPWKRLEGANEAQIIRNGKLMTIFFLK